VRVNTSLLRAVAALVVLAGCTRTSDADRMLERLQPAPGVASAGKSVDRDSRYRYFVAPPTSSPEQIVVAPSDFVTMAPSGDVLQAWVVRSGGASRPCYLDLSTTETVALISAKFRSRVRNGELKVWRVGAVC
jgi:hypothetical protein